MKTYNNAKELCEDSSNFWNFGRNLYKYTDCGPWCRLVLTEARVLYYDDKGADDPSLLDDPDIIGLEIGSIVEGSNAEVGPEFLKFPFTDKELWDTVENINDEANFYWKRDNESEYLIEIDDKCYSAFLTWGIEFSEDTPKNVRTFFENFWDDFEDMEEGEVREISDYKVTRIDKSMLTF